MIDINGRSFVDRGVTGVQRYAREITSVLSDQTTISPAPHWQNGIRGHLWEQLILPARIKGLLWSPSNTGPITVERQVVTIHDMATFEHPEWFDRRFSKAYQMILPQLSRRVGHILTVSEYSKNRIVSHLGVSPDKITVTPLAASKIFRPIPLNNYERQLLKLPEGYFLMVGALQERKNFRRVLEVWKTWERTGRPDDLGLVIIGSRESIFSSFKLDYVPEGVQFMDKVSDEILPKLYSSAVAFLFPSLYEGFGIPILEAMACGTPVITSNVTSMPEVADKAALLINPELHVSILQAMQTISSDGQLRDELRVAGLERAQQFSWERTALQTREVLEQAARRLGI